MRLTNQMLSFERLRGVQPSLIEDDIDTVVIELTKRLAPKVLDNNIEFTVIRVKVEPWPKLILLFCMKQ